MCRFGRHGRTVFFRSERAVHSSGSLRILPGVKPDLVEHACLGSVGHKGKDVSMRLKIIAPELDYYAEVDSPVSWEPNSTNKCVVNCHRLNSHGVGRVGVTDDRPLEGESPSLIVFYCSVDS